MILENKGFDFNWNYERLLQILIFSTQFMDDILLVGVYSHFRIEWKKLELRPTLKCQGGQ